MSRVMIVGGLLVSALASASFASETITVNKDRVYELRVYYANPGKLDALNARFRDHTCRLFQKHGIEVVGFWTPQDEKQGKSSTLYYILAFPSREAAKTSWDAFRADPEWQKVKEESEKDGALVGKFESTFLDTTDYSPSVPIAPGLTKTDTDARVFELRTYVASEGKLNDLHKRFREHTIELFKKHGMANISYWVPQDDAQGHENTLVYLLAFPSREAASASWKAFVADPEWQKVFKESQPDGVPLAGKVSSVYLVPTDYSSLK
jgi:uncharacterized protein (DUF1330 family)